jgi:hypothetical protein
MENANAGTKRAIITSWQQRIHRALALLVKVAASSFISSPQ